MNHSNPHDPYDDLPNHLLAASTLLTYRRRSRTHTLRRLALIIITLAGLLLLYRFAAAAPPAPTDKPWPPSPPARYYCQPSNPNPPAYCWRYRIHSRPPVRP